MKIQYRRLYAVTDTEHSSGAASTPQPWGQMCNPQELHLFWAISYHWNYTRMYRKLFSKGNVIFCYFLLGFSKCYILFQAGASLANVQASLRKNVRNNSHQIIIVTDLNLPSYFLWQNGTKFSVIQRALSSKADSFLSGASAVYVEQMYAAWMKDPSR